MIIELIASFLSIFLSIVAIVYTIREGTQSKRIYQDTRDSIREIEKRIDDLRIMETSVKEMTQKLIDRTNEINEYVELNNIPRTEVADVDEISDDLKNMMSFMEENIFK